MINLFKMYFFKSALRQHTHKLQKKNDLHIKKQMFLEMLWYKNALRMWLLKFEQTCKYRLTCLTAHNWQKWKSRFLTCHCHEIYREEAVGLKNSNYI